MTSILYLNLLFSGPSTSTGPRNIKILENKNTGKDTRIKKKLEEKNTRIFASIKKRKIFQKNKRLLKNIFGNFKVLYLLSNRIK
jgi:hypothetical protein